MFESTSCSRDSRSYVSAVVKRNFRHVYRSRNYYFFSLRLYVSLDEWISGQCDSSLSLPLSPPHALPRLGRESVDVIDEENQHSRLSLSHYLEEKSRQSLIEELCAAYELSATSVDLLPSLYKRIEREEQTVAMTSVMKVEKEGSISRYYYLADIEATSVHHSYQQHIRLFTWTKMTSLRWVLPRRTTTATTTIPVRDTTSAEREGLEFLDFSILTSLLEENNLDKLYGRKVMYLSLQRALFCSDDFHERRFPMFFNIEAIATSVQRSEGGGGSSSGGGGWEYVFKPAYFHFADVSQSTPLDELIAVLSKYQSDVSNKEVIKALTDARPGQREGNDVTTGVKRRARASSTAFQSQLSSLDLTHRVHMSYQEYHQQQSQLSSQMILYSISPLRERDLVKPPPPLPLPQREEEEEREARLILPVIAYDVALAELFQGITANLIALAIYRKQQQEEEKSTSLPASLPYDDICYDAINMLQQTSEHSYLVIVRFIQSCDDEEAMTCTNIDEMFAESYPSDVTPSHSTHPQQSSVIAILERLVL